jgi:cytochrome c oxidase subunit 2
MYSTTGIDASNFVETFNRAFFFTLGISLVFLIGLTILMFYFIYRYNKKRNKTPTQIKGNNFLEITWTVIPIILAMAMFHYGWAGWRPTSKPPKDGLNLTTTARMWSFSFTYENGKQSTDMFVPVGTPIKVKLVSLDVVHSVYIPEFRIKSDVVPGREKQMWFEPETVGDYDLFCAEYCGLRHSYMRAKVKVLSQEDFSKWYSASEEAQGANQERPKGEEGLEIMKVQGCLVCHSTDGSKIIGPTFQKLYGSTQTVIENNKEIKVTVDDSYIKTSVYDPNHDVVKGFPSGVMQSYKGTLNDSDIEEIIEYLKTLK